jgi:hypothetical protein
MERSYMANMSKPHDAYLSAWRAMIVAWQRTFIRRWTVTEIDGWRKRILAERNRGARLPVGRRR